MSRRLPLAAPAHAPRIADSLGQQRSRSYTRNCTPAGRDGGSGSALTGACFITVSRLPWRADLDRARMPVAIPLVLYVLNLVFATALRLAVGLWQPPLAAVVLGLAPLLLLRRARPRLAPAPPPSLARLHAARGGDAP